MVKELEADVVIVGGGVAGAAIARELSQYTVQVILVEKGSDLAVGSSKANNGHIHKTLLLSLVLKSAINPNSPIYQPGSLKTRLENEGYATWEQQWLRELDIQHKPRGLLVVARNKHELESLDEMKKVGEMLPDEYKMTEVDRDTILSIEPNVTREVIAGLYQEEYCKQVFPQELVFALGENARQNGVTILLRTEVIGVSRKNGYQVVETTKGPVKTAFIINAAGKYADKVADMGGARDWRLTFRKGQLILLDKRLRGLVTHFVNLPVEPGRHCGIVPHLAGNPYIVCGEYEPTEDRENLATTREAFQSIIKKVKGIVPAVSERDVIASFVGLRVFNSRDPGEHIIERSSTNPRFINVVLRLPGLAPAPAVAKMVVGMLGDEGLQLARKPGFNPFRERIPRFRELSNVERDALIASDARYGHVVCRCETVTEGEIIEAIRRGATTVQGVQFRTRAGMGRCQRGFCGPRVVDILARELGIQRTQVTFKGPGSEILKFQNKELLKE